MQITKEESDGVLKLAGKLNIWAVEETRDAFERSFADGDLLLNLSEVVACDVAGLQLLFSASKTAELLGRRFGFTGLSEAIRKTAVDGGFPPMEPHLLERVRAGVS
jgi:anti-anti-sigma regulatory factor